MTVDRSLTPADAAVAVRSFPRRFRALLAPATDDEERADADEVTRRVGEAGVTAAEHLATAAVVLESLDRSLRSRSASDPFPAMMADDGSSVSTLLDRLDGAATDAASQIDRVPNDDWSGLLAPTQDAVGAVADHLRAAQRVLSEVR